MFLDVEYFVIMGLNRRIHCCLVPFVCVALLASLASATVNSDGVFGFSVLGERRLLQAKKQCPVNFESQNYTIVTSQCKGPNYPRNSCCEAFKEFACPFADNLNDLTTNCASVMFSYLNFQGSYPPGLFSNLCKDGLRGLDCPAPAPLSSGTSRQMADCGLWAVMMLVLVDYLLMQLMGG